ncbi:MAG: cysteine--tRNA ligase [Hyphomicrobiaceae bacterium]
MALQLYNTLTRKKERFDPIDPTNVRLYVCGPTVYDLAHIGNARPIIVFDVLFRLLRHIYGADHVTYARNITDVDDKINTRAVERFPDMEPTAAIRRLTEETTAQFHKDIAALGVLPPTVEPRATDHIAEMRQLCEALVANGNAYVSHEHVLFDATSMADYGRLANRSLEEMEAGARVDVAPYKKGPTDFVLWKPSTPAQPGWPSPCGIATPGRPGWHIECSAMADRWLWSEPQKAGQLTAAGLAQPHVFDIHGGGIDLVFPHHENEIAQSRCAHGTPVMANYWMHNGFLQVEGEKMSKSLGNFITINELLETDNFGGHRWPRAVLRLSMMRTHYRQPINWTVENLLESKEEVKEWALALRENQRTREALREARPSTDLLDALSDDLNLPGALAIIRQQVNSKDEGENLSFAGNIGFLGLFNSDTLGAYVPGISTEGGVSNTVLFSNIARGENLKIAIANGNLEVQELIISELQAANLNVRTKDGSVTLSPRAGNAAVDDRIGDLIAARLEARKHKDFKESDRIRDELAAMGIQLKDSKNKDTGEIETTWEVKR